MHKEKIYEAIDGAKPNKAQIEWITKRIGMECFAPGNRPATIVGIGSTNQNCVEVLIKNVGYCTYPIDSLKMPVRTLTELVINARSYTYVWSTVDQFISLAVTYFGVLGSRMNLIDAVERLDMILEEAIENEDENLLPIYDKLYKLIFNSIWDITHLQVETTLNKTNLNPRIIDDMVEGYENRKVILRNTSFLLYHKCGFWNDDILTGSSWWVELKQFYIDSVESTERGMGRELFKTLFQKHRGNEFILEIPNDDDGTLDKYYKSMGFIYKIETEMYHKLT